MKDNKLLHYLAEIKDSVIDSIIFMSGIVFTLLLVTMTRDTSNSFKFQRKFSLGTQGGIV